MSETPSLFTFPPAVREQMQKGPMTASNIDALEKVLNDSTIAAIEQEIQRREVRVMAAGVRLGIGFAAGRKYVNMLAARVLGHENVSNREYARRLGVHPAYIQRLMAKTEKNTREMLSDYDGIAAAYCNPDLI